MESERLDMDQDTIDYYVAKYGAVPPEIQVGDVVSIKQYGPRRFTVLDFRANGMLVECVDSDGQEYCLPRYQADDGWVVARV